MPKRCVKAITKHRSQVSYKGAVTGTAMADEVGLLLGSK